MMTDKKQGVWAEQAQRVLRERYLLKKDGRVVETPDEMCWRVATYIAAAEEGYPAAGRSFLRTAEEFYDMMIEQKFLPNSPTLMNAGTGNGEQFSACFVLPVEDSIPGIFDAVKWQAMIHKSGGGTGFAFSRLRASGSSVKSTQGVASGPVSFMRIFDCATEQVKQGGKRRGANMGILRCDHPDVLDFIECKLEGGINNFNISVAVTDLFIEALARDSEYDLVDPQSKQVVGRLRARDVMDRIVRAAWRSGDPGLVFIDRINAGTANPVPALGPIEATNPCGEQPLYPFDACNLGSINLAKFVKDGPYAANPGRETIDWAELDRITRLSVRFLDDVIEVNPYPLQQITDVVHDNRRIGLGIMGWADMLLILGIPYDSDDALGLGREIMRFINQKGHEESACLAEERGPFPNWDQSIYKHGPLLRNSTVTTIAPTGTISIIAGASSGVEPLFAIAYRHIVGERNMAFVNPVFEQVAEHRGFGSDEVMQQVARVGSVHGVSGVPADVQRVFVTAHEIAPTWHVRMQAAFQAHTDNGVSKTINLPFEATVQDVEDAYMLAWREGCLGITVFRNGSKGGEAVLHVGAEQDRSTEDGSVAATGAVTSAPLAAPVTVSRPAVEDSPGRAVPVSEGDSPWRESARDIESSHKKPRPRKIEGSTYRTETPLGTAFITVNRNGGQEPFEVFLNVGKAGSDTAAVAEALGRLMSLMLRLPSPLSPTERVREIVAQLTGIGGGRPMGFGKARVRSLPDALAHVLAEDLGMALVASPFADLGDTEGEVRRQPILPGFEKHIGDLCPECGHATLIFEEGCQKCYSCGFSEC